ncbi:MULTISPECIES: DMT family transporter [Myxococcus]|uniref:DMT family transporter n=1 Tax=Myxococcus TaxID=32 RepID=UPI0013D323CB|nr:MULTISPECIES: multidrug efflux SMR transporter [Myxococcus]MCP3163236.1 multidrug efflux SMR transporter [Myxococcus qinghaiensis]NVJ27149.1 multidrug efflux SMR transporter [Myxococcus sp. AM011]
MAYLFLLGAIACEVVATSLLKSTQGFTRLWPTVGCLTGYAVAFALLSQAVKQVPVGVAYAMWSGLGTAAIVAIGVVFLDEPMSATKLLGVALIISGVVLLNLRGAH